MRNPAAIMQKGTECKRYNQHASGGSSPLTAARRRSRCAWCSATSLSSSSLSGWGAWGVGPPGATSAGCYKL
jgi:hypothetical protein